jgi:hypothetical protein
MAIKPHTKGVVGHNGLIALLICTVAPIGVGLFVTDPLDTPPDQMTARGAVHAICGLVQLGLLPFAALLINLSFGRGTVVSMNARRVLQWTAGLPLLALVAFVVHLSVYVIPVGDHAYGPNVPLGWPIRFVFLTYMENPLKA